MVFFTCNACGESLKKAQVEKHVLKCRGCEVLSCIDCGKDFWGEDYRNHNKCISEDQKYGGKDFQVKANKGDVKQLQWIERIQEAMRRPDIEPKLHQVLNQVSSYENVPRKRAKFQNWMKNSLKIHNQALIEQVWDIFSTATSNDSTQNNLTHSKHKENQTDSQKVKSEEISEQNGQNTSEKQRKKRKRQMEENDQNTDKKHKKTKQEDFDESLNAEGEESVDQQEESESNAKAKFNWKGTIKAVLRDAPEEGLAVKKLRKKVLAAYYSFSGDSNHKSEEEILSLFNKKINNNPKFKVLKDKVRLVK